MPRFVVLRHEPEPGSYQRLHWDFMLEDETTLLTWALDDEPLVGRHNLGVQLANHRLEYLDFEGPVSRARGCVSRWDAGTYVWLDRAPDVLVVRLDGQILCGRVRLERTPPDHRWVLSFSAESSSAEP